VAKTKLNGSDPLKKPATVGDLKSLVQALKPLIEETVSDQLRPLRRDMERFEGCIRDVAKLLQESLTLERQRLAKERDVEHRRFLSGVDLARRPDRPGATPEQLHDAALASTAFVAGMDSQRQQNASNPVVSRVVEAVRIEDVESRVREDVDAAYALPAPAPENAGT
jgi:hypothetical protein